MSSIADRDELVLKVLDSKWDIRNISHIIISYMGEECLACCMRYLRHEDIQGCSLCGNIFHPKCYTEHIFHKVGQNCNLCGPTKGIYCVIRFPFAEVARNQRTGLQAHITQYCQYCLHQIPEIPSIQHRYGFGDLLGSLRFGSRLILWS